MLLLTRSDVERLLPLADCAEAMRDAMIAVSEGRATMPLRQFVAVGAGKFTTMPGVLGEAFGVKLVAKFPRAADSVHGSHVGMVLLFDAADGLPVAIIEGGSLTAIRTAATSAMATDLLARADAESVLLVGAGEQARWHLRALRATRRVQRALVWARDAARAAAFAASEEAEAVTDLETAVARADIIVTATAAREPLVRGAWLRPGQHLTLVGSAVAEHAEIDEAAVAAARFVVDYRPAALAAAGELKRAMAAGLVGEDHILAEIGAVAAGRATGRRNDTDITLYKSLGVSAQDLAAATLLLTRARAAGAGTDIDLMA
ncbi:ornithine cyclodeaminase family protein [Sandaracinobacteroides saxicola]|uniref:Ornithine cyclodeaminase family protein n=1 Tax=Sandaracinobacteroides saxicola TaxID=2759707 RepID=A0A7G5IKE1_9SPHN|nr:ornithine cyclodeaminase family protein [Sandaracinobacteroides saxicola]QMW23833.1 ornithine cyclodeaminase family protein [Sandaracinobacteroides saxicola]